MALKSDPTDPGDNGEQTLVQLGQVPRVDLSELSPQELEMFVSQIIATQKFAGDNFKLNLEYQRLFYDECLKGDRAASWTALALIVTGVLIILGDVTVALLMKAPVDLLTAAGGIFTGILGGYVYNLHVKSRARLDKVARELSRTARELSSVGRVAVAKRYIDQLSDPVKKDEQLEKLIKHILQPNSESNDT